MADYGRYKIVGFDLRQGPLFDLGRAMPLGEYFPRFDDGRPPYRASTSHQVWRRSEKCDDVD